jgi:hypothetical protein
MCESRARQDFSALRRWEGLRYFKSRRRNRFIAPFSRASFQDVSTAFLDELLAYFAMAQSSDCALLFANVSC